MLLYGLPCALLDKHPKNTTESKSYDVFHLCTRYRPTGTVLPLDHTPALLAIASLARMP